MNKTLIYIILVLAIVVGGFFWLNGYIYKEKQADTFNDYRNAEYIIEGQRVQLTNGISETEAAPGSASKIVTRYFGNEVRHDLNNDGREDIVFLLTQETGGSGTFFYVVAALNTEHGYIGSQALLLGDRIAPQTTEKGNGNIIVVNYAERAPGEPMTAQPSIGKSIWLLLNVESMQFGEVAQDFEGEADPSRMKLDMKDWIWLRATYNDGRNITPKKAGVFQLTFSPTGQFSAKTDCNNVGGKYTVDKNNISFGEMFSTKMYCEGSDESLFTGLLENTQSFHFTSKGELIFDLKFDSGSVVFR